MIILQHRARQVFATKTRAVTMIQCHCRKLSQLLFYRSARFSIIQIQNQWRKNSCKTTFALQRKAIIVLQGRARHTFATKTQAATVIQCHSRKLFQQLWYTRARFIIIQFQNRWRQVTAQSSYALQQRAIIVLQGKARKTFANKLLAATMIQCYHRKQCQLLWYRHAQFSIIKIQSVWRQFTLRALFSLQRKGMIILLHRARHVFAIKTRAATMIQCHCRKLSQLLFYRSARFSTIQIQNQWRKKTYKTSFALQRKAIIVLQGRAKHTFATKTQAASMIQCYHRKQCQLLWYRHAQFSIIKIQSLWRQYTSRASFALQRKGMIILLHRARQVFAIKTHAATIIQCHCRKLSQLLFYRSARFSIIQIQNQWRKNICMTSFALQRKAIIVLQVKARHTFTTKTQAATVIQCYSRKLFQQLWYTRAWLSIIQIQNRWRQVTGQSSFALQQRAIIVLQDKARQAFANKWLAATMIQCYHRKQCQLLWYRHTQFSIIKIQSRWRQHTLRASFALHRKGMIILQQIARQMFAIKTRAATMIQCHCRKLSQLLCYRSAQFSIIQIQNQWRKNSCKTLFALQRKAIIVLQVKARQKFAEKIGSAVRIQCMYRMRYQLFAFLRVQLAVIQVQSTWRSFTHRSSLAIMQQGFACFQRVIKYRFLFRTSLVIVLQKQWRQAQSQRKFLQMRSGFLCLQSRWRRQWSRTQHNKLRMTIVAQMPGKKMIEEQHNSAMIINAKVRAFVAYLHYKRFRQCATLIQARQRGVVVLVSYRHFRSCIALFQARLRALLAVSSYRRLRSSITLIQKRQRGFTALSNYRRLRSCITLIQARQRSSMALSNFRHLRSCIISIQATLRRFMALSKHRRFRSFMTLLQRQSVRNLNRSFSLCPYERVLIAKWRFPTYLAKSRQCAVDWMLSPLTSHLVLPAAHKQVGQGLFMQSIFLQSSASVQLLSRWRRTTFDARKQLEWVLRWECRRRDIIVNSGTTTDLSYQPEDRCTGPGHLVLCPGVRFGLRRQIFSITKIFLAELQSYFGFTLQHVRGVQLEFATAKDAIFFLKWGKMSPNYNTRTISCYNSVILFGDASFPSVWVKLLEVLTERSVELLLMIFRQRYFISSVECHILVKHGLVVSLLILTSAAAAVGSHILFLAFLGLSISVAFQRLHNSLERAAAKKIQSCWRQFKVRNLYLQRRTSCIGIQRIFRKYQDMKRVAALKIQRKFRKTTNRILVGQDVPCQTDAKTRLLVLRGVAKQISRLVLVCWIVSTAVSVLRHTYCIAQVAFFIMELVGVQLAVAQICRIRNATLQRQRKSIITLQNAFRRRQSLKKWKTTLGVHDHEQQFCTKLRDFECLLDKLRCEILDEIVEVTTGTRPTTPMIEGAHPSYRHLCVDFLSEEKAAGQIQSWWRYMLLKANAASFIQHWFRGIKQRNSFLEIRYAARTIQNFFWTHLFVEKREQIAINDTLKELLDHRLQILSAVYLQRWYRMVAARSKYQLLNQSQTASDEGHAATLISRWWKHNQEVQETRDEESAHAIIEQAVRAYCEDRYPASRALAVEDSLMYSYSSGSDSFEAEAIQDVKFHIAEAENTYENKLHLPLVCTETESGLEMAVETTGICQNSCCCGGFEIFLSD